MVKYIGQSKMKKSLSRWFNLTLLPEAAAEVSTIAAAIVPIIMYNINGVITLSY